MVRLLKKLMKRVLMETNTNFMSTPLRRGCPDKCAVATDEQDLTAHELEHLSSKAQQEILRSPGRALICAYCGCVFIREQISVRRLGIFKAGWHSELFPR
jgi:hypothetical protein